MYGHMYRKRQISILLCIVFSVTAAGSSALAAERPKTAEDQELQQNIATLERMSAAFRAIAKRVQPTVVQISTTVSPKEESKPTNRRDRIDPKDLPPPLREFFEDFGEQPERQPTRGQGSGVIIDAEAGYILTNNHVVGSSSKEDRDRVRLDITLNDGRTARGSIVGQDPKTDIALLRFEEGDLRALKSGRGLQALPIGDSTKMEVGDWVLAIGAPFGLAESVTQGIISAKGRSNVGIVEGIEDFLQTDAAINPGNSGGPLVNIHGELIGINTAIATSGMTRGYMGIGFAIPTELIKHLLPDLKAGREIVRGYLGVGIKDLKQQPGLARTFGLSEDRGVLIDEVRPETPASKAGLKVDDVILSIDNTRIETATQLQLLVARTKPGNKLNLGVWRDGKEIKVPVTIEMQPEDFYASRIRGRGGRPQDRNASSEQVKIELVGMSVARATPELAKKFGLDPDEVSGEVIVTEVDPLGEAAAVRISTGDIIVSVQGREVKAPAALKKELSAEALGQGVRLRIRNDYGTRTVFLQVAP